MFDRSIIADATKLPFGRVTIARGSAFENHRSDLLRSFRAGASIELAAEQCGVAVNTLRRWLSNGRNKPDGPYGEFAADVDRIRRGDMDLIWLARDYIDALRGAFQSEERGPALQRVAKRIGVLSSDDRAEFELRLAEHLILATMLIYPSELGVSLEAGAEAFYMWVDGYYRTRESLGLDAA